jgi:hypothetical protein
MLGSVLDSPSATRPWRISRRDFQREAGDETLPQVRPSSPGSLMNAVNYRVSTLAMYMFYTLFGISRHALAGFIRRTVHGFSYAQMTWYLIMTEFIAPSAAPGSSGMNEDVKSRAIVYLLGGPTHYVLFTS